MAKAMALAKPSAGKSHARLGGSENALRFPAHRDRLNVRGSSPNTSISQRALSGPQAIDAILATLYFRMIDLFLRLLRIIVNVTAVRWFMRHDWIFDVLNDLQNYAEKNGLSQIAAETSRLMVTARAELTAVTRAEQISAQEPGKEQVIVPANTDAKLIK